MRGDGSLYKRCECGKPKWAKCPHPWWMKFSRDGRAFSMTCHTSLKSEAGEKLRAELSKSKNAQWLEPKQRRVTVGELIEDFKQALRIEGDKAENRLKDVEARWENHLKAHFEHLQADKLTTKDQRDYREKRRKKDGNSTINRELGILRRAYKLASEAEPPKVLRVPKFELTNEDGNARKVFIDTATEDKLKAAATQCGLWQRVMVEMAFAYGWRRGELVGLFVRNIDLADRTIRLDKTKNGEAREVPILSQNLFLFLQALVTGKNANEQVFAVSVRTAQYEWERICKLAGVKAGKDGGIIMHDIRRSSARNKRAAGVDTSLIMNLQGWKTDAMFRRYAIADRSDLVAALQKETTFKQELADSRKADAELQRTATEQLQSAHLPQA